MLGQSKASTLWSAACGAAVTGFALFIVHVDYDWYYVVPSLGAFASLIMLVVAASRRWRFASVVSLLFFAAIWGGTTGKFALVAINLHVYDVIFYMFSLAQIGFLFDAYPKIAWPIVAAAVVGTAALITAYRYERPLGLARRGRAGLALAACGCVAITSSPLAGRNGQFFADQRFFFSAFISSFADLPQLVRFKGLIEVAPSAAAATAPIASSPISCRPEKTPPDIVLFLNESAMPPGVYPSLAYPAELDRFFTGGDGRIHPLRVETFGGGTWLTDFSALTGLSTRSFGTMRNFVANFMTGRLRHSLPQYLKACGYETSVVYPASADFAGVGRFYQAIGFDRIVDLKIHHAPDQRQRDEFYLNETAKILEANAASGAPKPQFILASSMSTHMPWDFRFAPEMPRETDTLNWNGDTEFDEYLWRLVLAKRDRDAFRERLARSMPNRPVLHIGYGDHQPALAKVPLDGAEQIANEGTAWQLDPTSKAFETYYTIDAQNFTPMAGAPNVPILEVAHLATVAVMAAGLPLDPVYKRRAQLLQTCKGLYATCEDRAAVLTFQRWLVDGQWILQN